MLPETIKTRVLAYYETNYTTFLAQVEANHADDPITLDDFKERIFSNTRLFQVGRQYPYLDIASTVSRPESEAQQSVLAGRWGTIIEIRKRFRGQNLEALAKTIDRHMEAFLLMVDDDGRLGGALPLGLTNLEFRVIESNEPFFQGLLIRFLVRHKI